MMKLFVISDIHSYYDEMIDALHKAGFDKDNLEHWLIGCGDYIDRGPKPKEVIDYLMALPRKVLVRGNHEDLLEELCERERPYQHDLHNGTLQTVMKLGEPDEYATIPGFCRTTLTNTQEFRESLVDYFETQNYIFVHSWIPLLRELVSFRYEGRVYSRSVYEDWRKAPMIEWLEARWGNPYEYAHQGLLPDKTIVFGHWNTSWPRARYEGQEEFGPNADFSPYYGKGYVGLDACTATTKIVNVLVLEDEFMEQVR